MFDQLPAAMQDRVSDALYKWRGIAYWPEGEAHVLKSIWTPGDDELSGDVGNYRVRFTYQTSSGLQNGSLGINGYRTAPPYKEGDVFTLRYHPKHPARFYYANEPSRTEKLALLLSMVALGIVGAFILIFLFR